MAAVDELYCRALLTTGPKSIDLAGDVVTLEVDERESGPAACHLVLNDPELALGTAVREGGALAIELGTAADHPRVFSGVIYRVEEEMLEGESPQLDVTAYDAAMLLGLRRRSRSWTSMSLEAVVKSVAGQYRLVDKSDKELSSVTLPGTGVRQQNETDLAFLLRLGEDLGAVIAITANAGGDTLSCQAEKTLLGQAVALTLAYRGAPGCAAVSDGVTLTRFSASSDLADVRLPIALTAVDPKTGNLVRSAQASEPAPGALPVVAPEGPLIAAAVHDGARARELDGAVAAEATVRASQRAEVGAERVETVAAFRTAEELQAALRARSATPVWGQTASGVAAGSPRLRPRIRVDVKGVAPAFAGAWYVTEARHVLADQTYQTEFKLRR